MFRKEISFIFQSYTKSEKVTAKIKKTFFDLNFFFENIFAYLYNFNWRIVSEWIISQVYRRDEKIVFFLFIYYIFCFSLKFNEAPRDILIDNTEDDFLYMGMLE